MNRVLWNGIFCLLLLRGTMTTASPQQQDETIDDHEIKVTAWEDLAYPGPLLAARLQGVVVVDVHLDDTGRVTQAYALSGVKELARVCVENVKRWKFAPNTKKRAFIVYEFRIDGSCNSNAHSLFQLRHANFASITACSTPL